MPACVQQLEFKTKHRSTYNSTEPTHKINLSRIHVQIKHHARFGD